MIRELRGACVFPVDPRRETREFLRAVSALPPVKVHYPHVDVRDDLLGGSPVVRGTRVPVRRLWSWHRRGITVETLLKRYPQLGPAKVLCALSFAYDNAELVDADLARERALVGPSADDIPGAMKQEDLFVGKKEP